ncbi:hypothetical protein RMSM_00517 [Rhodopirellula maiorica SM1]|uniref:Secreted protein n=1 Tax=Rhodopirellula maiorica SM1 TaxID=1265738 RepID=M5RTE1_9BACT|nr:hypothetical protein RMSM_00517 [Rhodopirellula maiorica SM1]
MLVAFGRTRTHLDAFGACTGRKPVSRFPTRASPPHPAADGLADD